MLNLKKLFSEAKNKNKVENFAHFERGCVFLEKRHLSSISYFSNRRKYLLRLKSSFSWSAVQALSDDVKKTQKKFFTESLNCLHLNYTTKKILKVWWYEIYTRNNNKRPRTLRYHTFSLLSNTYIFCFYLSPWSF